MLCRDLLTYFYFLSKNDVFVSKNDVFFSLSVAKGKYKKQAPIGNANDSCLTACQPLPACQCLCLCLWRIHSALPSFWKDGNKISLQEAHTHTLPQNTCQKITCHSFVGVCTLFLPLGRILAFLQERVFPRVSLFFSVLFSPSFWVNICRRHV